MYITLVRLLVQLLVPLLLVDKLLLPEGHMLDRRHVAAKLVDQHQVAVEHLGNRNPLDIHVVVEHIGRKRLVVVVGHIYQIVNQKINTNFNP